MSVYKIGSRTVGGSELSSVGASSVTSRSRNLLGLRGTMMCGGGAKEPDWVYGCFTSNTSYSSVLLYNQTSLDVGFEVTYDSQNSIRRFMNLWNPDTSTGFGYGIVFANVAYIFGDVTQRQFVSHTSQLVGKHTISFNYLNSRSIVLDGVVTVENMVAGSTFQPTKNSNLFLFDNQNGSFHGGNGGYCYSAKIYSAKVSNGTDIVRDCYPIIDDDGNGALYDSVEKTTLTNGGTIALTYGWDD